MIVEQKRQPENPSNKVHPIKMKSDQVTYLQDHSVVLVQQVNSEGLSIVVSPELP